MNGIERTAPVAVTASMRARQRILVVDDQPDCAEAVYALLHSMGHEYHHASSGERALNVARAREPDVVLLDIRLPDMCGLEVARAVRRQARRQPYLVAMTGWSHPEDRQRTLAAGFDAHLIKPVNMATLERIVSATPSASRMAPALAIVR